MSFRRYVAGTVREGLDRVRRELGEDAVILSNKRLGPGRIEIVAAASDSMQALVEEADRPSAVARQNASARERTRSDEPAQSESFQDFVRRQAPAAATRTGQEPRETTRPRSPPRAEPAPARAEATPARAPSKPAHAAPPAARGEPAPAHAGVAMYHEVASARDELDAPLSGFESTQEPVQAAPAVFRQRTALDKQALAGAAINGTALPGAFNASPARPAAPVARPAAPEPAATLPPAPAAQALPAPARPPEVHAAHNPERDDARVMAELRSLRAALSDRIAALESNIALNRPSAAVEVAAPPNPAATRVMTRLLMSGFSPDLARRVATHVPPTGDIAAMDTWLHEVVAGNLRCADGANGLLESQGAVALVGPTGVGKTTTVAKLAARFAVRYGASQLGLITLDSYRIGAHEQLRSYGRILGVPMHIAQDGAMLRELLSSLQGKRLVLIDTCGLSQRDERMEEMLGTLSAARFNMQPIRRVLLLNAASHSETLDEVARAWRAPDAAGAILTKLDEAARIGGAVDCLLRYRMTMFGLTNGQRVPEDWHPAGARLIAHVALKPSTTPFALGDAEAQAWAEQPQGSAHA
jgi:flagellar biosynthesis protein FlhF